MLAERARERTFSGLHWCDELKNKRGVMKTRIGNQLRLGNTTSLPSCLKSQVSLTLESEKGA